VSLTRHLSTAASPVRRFFEDRLGQTRQVVTDANRALRAGQPEPSVRGDGNPWLVGTAVDILLNAWLDPGTPPARQAVSPMADGARMVADSQLTLTELLSVDDTPSAGDWPHIARHSLLLASFVTAYRSTQGLLVLRENLEGAPFEFDEYSRRLWREVDERDLCELGPVALADHAFMRSATEIAVNPTFALSQRLSGADADVVVDRTLWDYKASRRQSVLRREDIWQLVGYALADTDNAFQIEALGITALRWRTRHVWAIRELVANLSGVTTERIDLAQWRREFEEVVPQRRAATLRRGDGK
jgi:hypothetical protein